MYCSAAGSPVPAGEAPTHTCTALLLQCCVCGEVGALQLPFCVKCSAAQGHATMRPAAQASSWQACDTSSWQACDSSSSVVCQQHGQQTHARRHCSPSERQLRTQIWSTFLVSTNSREAASTSAGRSAHPSTTYVRYQPTQLTPCVWVVCRFDNVYVDNEYRVAVDIRGSLLVVARDGPPQVFE